MRSLHEDIFSEGAMRDILLQKRLYGSHPDREVLQNRRLSCRPLMHVPVHSDDMGRFVYVLPDEVFHIYLSCMFPGKPSHNLLRIHADNDTRRSSSDILPDR